MNYEMIKFINAQETIEHAYRDRVDTRERIAQMIARMPEELVRCKNCRYKAEYTYGSNGFYYKALHCKKWKADTDSNGFCHKGERWY